MPTSLAYHTALTRVLAGALCNPTIAWIVAAVWKIVIGVTSVLPEFFVPRMMFLIQPLGLSAGDGIVGQPPPTRVAIAVAVRVGVASGAVVGDAIAR